MQADSFKSFEAVGEVDGGGGGGYVDGSIDFSLCQLF
jgi:hypothetical protein